MYETSSSGKGWLCRTKIAADDRFQSSMTGKQTIESKGNWICCATENLIFEVIKIQKVLLDLAAEI